MFKLSKVAGLQSATLLKMNYFTGLLKLSEWLHLISNNSKFSTASTSWQHKPSTFLFIAPHLLHLYNSVTFWILVDFSCVLEISVPRQRRLCLKLNSDVYSEHGGTSKMELFSKIVDAFQPLPSFTKSAILDAWMGSGYASETLFHIAYWNPITDLLFLIFFNFVLLK